MVKCQEATFEDEYFMINHGLWSEEEHERFLRACQMFPANEWTQIARYVRTRNPRQVRSHSQKIQAKTARHNRGLRKIRKHVNRREHRLDGVLLQVPVTSTNENVASSSSEPTSTDPPALPDPQIETALEFDHRVVAVDLRECRELEQFCAFLKEIEYEGLL